MKMMLQVGGKRSRFGAVGLLTGAGCHDQCSEFAFSETDAIRSGDVLSAVFAPGHSLASARYALRSLSNSLMYLSLVLT